MKFSGSSLIRRMKDSWLGRLELRFLNQWADHILVLNEGMLDEADEVGLDTTRIAWMPNPVDMDEFRPPACEERVRLRREFHLPVDAPVVLFVGRLAPEKELPSLISGFREVYRFGASHRRELLTQLENVVNTRVRYTLRDTLEYYQALTEMLRSGVTAEAVLGPLPPARAGLSTLRPDETSSMEQLDIPRFTLASASRDLGGVKNCLAASGYELAVQGIEGLSDKDLQQQEAFIQLAWSLFRVSRSLS